MAKKSGGEKGIKMPSEFAEIIKAHVAYCNAPGASLAMRRAFNRRKKLLAGLTYRQQQLFYVMSITMQRLAFLGGKEISE